MNPFFYIILKSETDISPEESRLYYLAIKIHSKGAASSDKSIYFYCPVLTIGKME